MAVQFIIGRAGAGKTQVCRDQTAQACAAEPLGKPIFWIVPRQATFQTERDLCAAAGTRGVARARVFYFESFAQHVLSLTGGCSLPSLSRAGRHMVLAALLRELEPSLTFFKSVATRIGLAEQLAGTFDELEAGGADLKTLAENVLADGGGNEGASLATKFDDLRLIYEHYTAFLGQERLDTHRRMEQATSAISACEAISEATVYIDGFYDFAAAERSIIAALGARCRQVIVTLTLDSAGPTSTVELFTRSRRAFEQLTHLLGAGKVPVDKPMVLKEAKRFSAGSLRHLERWQEAPKAITADGSVELIETPDLRTEIDAVARKIQDLTAQGMRYRDIAVIGRDLADYADIIAASFAEHGIAFFLDRRRPAVHHPLIQFVRCALQIAVDNGPAMLTISWLKTGLAPLQPNEVDELENYCLLHGVTSADWFSNRPWTGNRAAGLDEDDPRLAVTKQAALADGMRRKATAPLTLFMRRLQPPRTVQQYCQALYDLLLACDVPGKLAAGAAHSRETLQLEPAAETEAVWKGFVELLDQTVDLLGERTMPLAGFVGVLETALSRFDLAIAPPTLDQVLVGQIDRVRLPAIRAAFVIGLNQGEFPIARRPETVLTDADRRTLRTREVDLDADAHRRINQETFYGYLALTRASEKLVLVRALTDTKGHPTAPSIFWHRVKQSIRGLNVRQCGIQPIEEIATPRQFITHLAHWVRQGADEQDDVSLSLYQSLADRLTDQNGNDALATTARRAWPALVYANEAALSPDIAARLFVSPLEVRARQLESFAHCPFQHFLKYGLALAARGKFAVSGQDLSQVYHDVLNALLKTLLSRRQTWVSAGLPEMRRLVHDLVEKRSQELKGNWMIGDARHRYLLGRIERTLLHVVDAQRAAAELGAMEPAFPSLRYGPSGDLPALEVSTEGGRSVRVSGMIDRVDVAAPENVACIVDYRLAAGPMSLPMAYWGLSIKAMVDLLALDEGRSGLHPPVPPAAGGLDMPLLRKIEDKHPDEALEITNARFALRCKPRGLFSEQAIPALDGTLQPGDKSVFVQVHIKKDGLLGVASDAISSERFAALLSHVKGMVAHLTDQIIDGVIVIRPFRLGKQTPCPTCSYRSVCRFEPRSGYRNLDSMSRDDVLRLVLEQADGAAGQGAT